MTTMDCSSVTGDHRSHDESNLVQFTADVAINIVSLKRRSLLQVVERYHGYWIYNSSVASFDMQWRRRMSDDQ